MLAANMDKFCIFVLSHGRPQKPAKNTIKMLRSCGYTGRIMVVCDNEDATIDEYFKNYGKENIYVFDKKEASKKWTL